MSAKPRPGARRSGGRLAAAAVLGAGLVAGAGSVCADPAIPSLQGLSIEALRERGYGSSIQLVRRLSSGPQAAVYRSRFSADGTPPYETYVGAYDSDGARVYVRIDLPPTRPPAEGFPVVIFVHGWYGREAAPDFDFMYRPDSVYGQAIDRWVDAGFLVASPALRGHGTVDGVPAGGIETLDLWDNATYLSPIYYAIDVLNLLEGLPSLEHLDFSARDRGNAVATSDEAGVPTPIRIDRARINISGHSQGADAVLTALAVSGEGSALGTRLATGSLWSGCFAPRFEQARVYGTMQTTLEAFMSGDGSWTGSAVGHDGSVNPEFVFGYPPDWIGTVDPSSSEWTWQSETWSLPSVSDALEEKFTEMYSRLNAQVGDIANAGFEVRRSRHGRSEVLQDPAVADAMNRIGGFNHPQYLTEPLHLHHSDRDFYSLPAWNSDLAARVNQAGGQATDFSYSGNSHALLHSEYAWFSSGEVVAGLDYMLDRDIALFSGPGAESALQADRDRLSVHALQRYAGALHNEFRDEFERPRLDGLQRRVVSFEADGLRQFALVVTPPGTPPEKGWPVLIMNHGYHPDPPNYGRVADGSTDRPGDYYRGLPAAFARRGFLVVAPDYRGHNDSEGTEYTRGAEASRWYARDVIAAFRALSSLPAADTSQVFMWGHSMGARVTLLALLALGNEVAGASLWSGASGHLAESDGPDAGLAELAAPLLIHHAVADPVTPFAAAWSLFRYLQANGRPVRFYSYPARDHLFGEPWLEQAIDTDARYFERLAAARLAP